jgi:hypothetical protein
MFSRHRMMASSKKKAERGRADDGGVQRFEVNFVSPERPEIAASTSLARLDSGCPELRSSQRKSKPTAA